MSEPANGMGSAAIERAMRDLGAATAAMAPSGPGIGVLMLRAELERAREREVQLASIASASGLALFGLALVAVLLRFPASPDPLTLLLVALPVVSSAIFGGLTLVESPSRWGPRDPLRATTHGGRRAGS